MGTAYDWQSRVEPQYSYEDLGLIINGGAGGAGAAVADDATVLSAAITDKEWTRTISLMVKASKDYEIYVQRTDKDGTVAVNYIIGSKITTTAGSYVITQITAPAPGASFKIGIKNKSGDASTNAIYVRATLFG